MCSTKKENKFDYSKYNGATIWDHELLKQYEFWGFHPKKGRLHIDTKRYKKACESVGITDFLPEGLFQPRNTTYFIPAKIHRDDYKVNIFRNLISNLRREWEEEEYKPVFERIKTPRETYDNYRINALMYTSCTDDYDEIEVEAGLASFKRIETYNKVLNDLYCMFLQKIATEIDRFTLIFMKECGYEGTDFSFDKFKDFTEKVIGKDSFDLFKKLDGYNCYILLHKINNFLKHNSKDSYLALSYSFPRNVRSKKNGTSDIEYENGMFAGNWIILKKGYIDKVFPKLIGFFEKYCKMVFNEDLEESKWNYDDYFYEAKKVLEWPADYFGI